MKPTGTNWELSSLARSWRINGGLVGFSFPNADSGPNGLPTHPFKGRMSYPAIDGVQHMSGRLRYRNIWQVCSDIRAYGRYAQV